MSAVADYVIPIGSKRGKRLGDLTDESLSGLRGSYAQIKGDTAKEITKNASFLLMERGRKLKRLKNEPHRSLKVRKPHPAKREKSESPQVTKLRNTIKELKKENRSLKRSKSDLLNQQRKQDQALNLLSEKLLAYEGESEVAELIRTIL